MSKCEHQEWINGRCADCDESFIQIVNQIKARSAQGDWVKTKDRLPEIHTPVLARIAYQSETIIAELYGMGSWFEQSAYEVITGDAITTHILDDYEITHWMPLPEPPEDKT